MSSNAPNPTTSPEAAPPTRRRRGAPRGNKNRQTHGAYAQPTQPITSIEDLVTDALAKQTRLSAYIESHAEEMDTDAMLKLLALYGQNASRLGRLLRDKRALSGEAANGLMDAIGAALDEIGTELGRKL